MATDQLKICIVGAGLTGSLLALYLAKRGLKSVIYEKRPDFRNISPDRNRTIAMSLSERGWHALKEVDMLETVQKIGAPKYGRATYRMEGTPMLQHYGKSHQAIYTVNRRDLNNLLLEKAESTGMIDFHFEHICTDINFETNTIDVQDKANGSASQETFDYIFGADGGLSSVREIMERNTDHSFKTQILSCAYKELEMPPLDTVSEKVLLDYLHIWVSRHAFIMAQMCCDGSFISTLFNDLQGTYSFNQIRTDEDVVSYFNTSFPSLKKYIPDILSQYFINPTSNIHTVECPRWNYRDRSLLIGDAAHAMAPFYGMGMNTCFEDCSIFNALLDEFDGHMGRAITQFTSRRKEDADLMARLSLKNFDSITASIAPTYDAKWKLERLIAEHYPELFTPQYVLIAFTRMPISQVIRKAENQNRMIENILKDAHPDIFTDRKILEQSLEQYFVEVRQ
ncbi:FAD-dependent oxidoreductase [Roseivirga sp. BDSF3-8]|uniref:FAD-dependent oxidoreductase n=1 Tax=Roseivirga sp. BDSF3-8 TaxID=3241598 RepID=UPI00353199CB